MFEEPLKKTFMKLLYNMKEFQNIFKDCKEL